MPEVGITNAIAREVSYLKKRDQPGWDTYAITTIIENVVHFFGFGSTGEERRATNPWIATTI